jgi:hypothetical protein
VRRNSIAVNNSTTGATFVTIVNESGSSLATVGHAATVGPVLPLIQGVTEAPGVNSVPKRRAAKSLDTQA